jgi:catechol 2,3-dioxygenase-like lactoylglutathione lyase family enzyme
MEERHVFGKIYSVTIVVADQDKALDFYVNTLGWEKGMDNQMGPDMRFLTVIPSGAETSLVLGHTSWFQDVLPPAKIGISLTTPDIDATYETLTSRGVTFKQPVEMMPWGQKAAWFYDIDENEFFLVEE